MFGVEIGYHQAVVDTKNRHDPGLWRHVRWALGGNYGISYQLFGREFRMHHACFFCLIEVAIAFLYFIHRMPAVNFVFLH